MVCGPLTPWKAGVPAVVGRSRVKMLSLMTMVGRAVRRWPPALRRASGAQACSTTGLVDGDVGVELLHVTTAGK